MASPIRIGSMIFTKPNDTQLLATREIDAPRERVWAAHTQCELVERWLLGPDGWTMPSCEMDLRPGGTWRYVYKGPDGGGFQMSGAYKEVQAPERLVNTERMDDFSAETLNTMTLTERNGRTLIRTLVEYPSNELREEIIATGMMDGWAQSYDLLEKLLTSGT
jgi:uncharacterized protein YndB with AHSA1/START domain